MSNLILEKIETSPYSGTSPYSAILMIMVIFMAILSGYLYFTNWELKKELLGLDKKKEKEYKQQLAKERGEIRRDFDEKYRADMVSFEALAKRSQIERKRLRELEGQVQALKDKNSKPKR